MTEGLFIGLMSGTSADAVDAALVRIKPDQTIQFIAGLSRPHPETLRTRLLDLNVSASLSLCQFGDLDNEVAEAFADTALTLLRDNKVSANQITAIGSHGQTIAHQPDRPRPFTLQIGNPSLIAIRCAIDTVADFRRADIAAGGTGAPLVPAFHQQVLASASLDRVVVNLGGIANVTILDRANPSTGGFDTGPANTLMDLWHRKHKNAPYDVNGNWSRSGAVIPELLHSMLADPYFRRTPPKTTGPDYFNEPWLDARLCLQKAYKPEDVQATLCELTTRTIADAVKSRLESSEVVLCGGGCHNDAIVSGLIRNLGTGYRVTTTAEFGVDPDYCEAIAFAWLACRTLRKQSGNLPSVTGADQKVVLGGLFSGRKPTD